MDFFFPPVKMQESSRKAPGPALAPEVPSNDSFSNTLKNPEVCNGAATLNRTWDPIKKDTGTTNANGEAKKEYVAQDAIDLKGEMDLANLSNNGFRDFHTFLARGEIKSTQEELDKSFTDFSAAGMGSANRATPISDSNVYRSLLLKQASESLNKVDKVDTVTQDYQIAWSCGGALTELSKKPNGCRPITLSEVFFGLQDEEIYYTSANDPPTTPPGGIISNLDKYFGDKCSSDYGCYKERFPGKKFSPLSKNTYMFILKQLNYTPKGDVNNKVTVTRYACLENGEKACPTPTIFNHNYPNAAALLSDQAYNASKMINPANQASLPNTDLCNNTTVNDSNAIDSPPVGLIQLFVNGLFKHLEPGESYTRTETNEVKSENTESTVKNSAEAEKTFANLIPNESQQDQGLRDKAFASKTSANANYPITDTFNRGDAFYNSFAKWLRPSSW